MRFVDANVFVYHMAQDPRYGEPATGILKRIEDGEGAATSTLAISQVCGYLKWKGRWDAVPSFLAFLRSLPNLLKADTTFIDLVRAQEICTEHDLDWRLWDDLVIVAQMDRLGIDEIYSNDADFDAIPRIRRIFK
jgi:predicted nucleic acid-binding protein